MFCQCEEVVPPKQNSTLECPGYKAFQVPWVYDRVLTGPHGHKTTRKHSAIWAYGFTMFQEAKLLASQIMDLFWRKTLKKNISQTRITVCCLEHQLGVEHLENCHRIPQHFQTENTVELWLS